MSKMSKAIAVLGVVAGLGVAALPLSTYAALGDALPEDAYKKEAQAQVQVKVGGAISIATTLDNSDSDSYNTDTKTVDLGELMPGGATDDANTPTLYVKVTSNDQKDAKYGLYMNALDGVTDMVGTKPGARIPTDTNVAPGTSAWGYKLRDETGANFATSYSKIPETASKIVDTTALNNTNTYESVTSVKFGASASTSQMADTYTGTVVFTAALEN